MLDFSIVLRQEGDDWQPYIRRAETLDLVSSTLASPSTLLDRLVDGLLRYLFRGPPEPPGVREPTLDSAPPRLAVMVFDGVRLASVGIVSWSRGKEIGVS